MAYEKGYERFEWNCLDWNTPSIEFYLKIGAVPLKEWTTYRLSKDAMKKLIKESSK
jgi:RimJ/RimL family protein N-acetyltransferase